MLVTEFREQVLINEARSEWRGSIAAWLGLLVVTLYLSFEFAERAGRLSYALWLGAMSTCLTAWVCAWMRFVFRRPSDTSILTRWIPRARTGMTVCNAVVAASVWVFLPVADAELRALLVVLYAWYLIVQFAAATEATQVLSSAVLMILGSLTLWLLVEQPRHFVALALFLPLFGATLLAIRRFVRAAVVAASQAQAAAEASQRDLAAALVDLERERDAKTQFIRAASHDLQQPLQAAGLFLSRIRPAARAADQTQALDSVKRSLALARNLVESMLQQLRLEADAVRPEFASFRARDLFDRIALTQGLPAATRQIRLSFVGHRLPLHTDFHLLARATENLVSNAIRHSDGARVLIGAQRRAHEVIIWVIDDGRGLSSEEAARVFAPFAQGSHVGEAGGFGLGLASSSGLAKLLGGACGVQRRGAAGSAFYIRIPAAAVSDEVTCAA